MPLPVEQAQRLINDYKGRFQARFPKVSNLSDMDLARRIKSVKQTDDFDDYIDSNVLTRAAGRTNIFLGDIGERAERGITNIGLPQGVGRGANFLIQSAPEMASGLASSFLKGPSAALRVATMGIPAITAGFRAGAETGSRTHVIGSAASVPLSFLGAEAVAKRYVTPLARAAGGMVGGAAGDLAEIGSHPGLGENPLARTKNFFSDPNNAIGYAIAQLPFAGVDYLVQKGQNVAETVERRRAAIPTPSDIVNNKEQATNFLRKHGIEVPEEHVSGPIKIRVAKILQSGTVSESQTQLSLFEQVPIAERPQHMADYMKQLEGQIIEEENFKSQMKDERMHSLEDPGPSKIYDLKTTVGDTFLQNNFLQEFQTATKPRVKSGRVLPPELVVKPDQTVSGKATAQLLGRWAPRELAELPGVIELKKELSGKKRIKVDELWQKFTDVMPEIEVLPLVPYDDDPVTVSGRYDNNPISFPEMDRPVEIYVKDPSRTDFEDPHFGDEVRKGMVVSTRGYFHDADTFFVYEIQSTAGQARRKAEEAHKKGFEPVIGQKLVAVKDPSWPDSEFLANEEYATEVTTGVGSTLNPLYMSSRVAKTFGIKVGDTIDADMVKKLETRFVQVPDHPLFPIYNRIAIKTAVKHAKDNGAKYIVFPDAETAMMIQGHDENSLMKKVDTKTEAEWWTSRNREWAGLLAKYQVGDEWFVKTHNEVYLLTSDLTHLLREKGLTFQQEGGMRVNYDQDIPKEARRLTKNKGKKVAVTKLDIPVREGRSSKAFKEPDLVTDKDTATGISYDITKIDPSEFRLFNLYDSANQSTTEVRVNQAVDNALVDGEYMTQEKFLDSVIPTSLEKAGDHTALVLSRWLGSIRASGVTLRTFDLGEIEGTTVRGFTEKSNQIGVNLTQSPERAIGTTGHEFSHTATHELAKRNPQDFKTIDEFVHEYLGQDGMRALLTDLQKLTKTEDVTLDIDYLIGRKFAADDPNVRMKTTYEFIAGVNELLTIHEYRQATQGRQTRVDSFLNLLPYPLQRQIRIVVDKLRQWFGPHYPSMAHLLGPEEQARMFKMLDLMGGTILRNETAQRKAFELLGNTERFNPDSLLESLPYGIHSLQEAPGLEQFPPEIRAFSKATVNLPPEGVGSFVKWFMSGLYRAQLYPFARPIFESLHHFRRIIKEQVMENVSILGQGPEGSKGFAADNLQAQNVLIRYSEPTKLGRRRRARVGKAMDKNQDLRAEGLDVLTNDQMKNEYGLNEEDLYLVNNTSKMMELSAQNKMNDMIDRDGLDIAQMVYSSTNKVMGLEDAQEIGTKFTRFGHELGFYKIRIAEVEHRIKGLEEGTAERVTLVRELESLKAEESRILQITEKSFRQFLKGYTELNPEPGKDGLINMMVSAVREQGFARMKYTYITKNPGYASKVRTRRFVVLVHGQDADGNVVTKEVKDFDKQSQAEKYAAGKQEDNTQIDVLDKDKAIDRYKYFTVKSIRDLMQEANTEFSGIIEKYKTEVPDGPAKSAIIETLENLRSEYRPLQSDVRDAISVRGDPLTEQRKNVPGMRIEDYMPNILETVSTNAVAGRKAVTRSFTDLYMLQPEFDQNPELKMLTKRDRDYVLGGEKGEMNQMRRYIFYFYLGASIRHVTQNAFQIFLNGIPEMVRRGGGYVGSYNKMFRGMNFSAQYALRGTSGDEIMDILLKMADQNGVTLPDHMEAFLPDSTKIDATGHLTALFGDGNSTLLEKPKWAAQIMGASVGKILRSTSAFSETVNRRISFTMGVLHGREKGVTDINELFRMGQEFSDNVNFVGNKANRPGFIIEHSGTPIHGPLLVMTALRSFTINHISQMASFWKEGKIGSYDVINKQRREDAGQFSMMSGSFNIKNPSSRALVASIGHLVAVSGVMGLLLMDDLDNLMEGLTGFSFRHWMRSKIVGPDALIDIEEESGNLLADLALGGLPAMVGMEASASLGLGRIADVSAGRQATMFNNPIVGPAGGLLEKAGRAIGAVAKDPADPNNWEEAVRNIAPFSLTYWMRLTDAATKNQFLDRRMKPVTETLSGRSALPLSLGFSPLEVADTQRVKYGDRRDQERQDRERRDVVNAVARLLHEHNRTGDPSVLAKAQQRFANYQSKAPGILYDKRSLLESISLATQQYAAPVNQPPSLAHHRLLEARKAAYPSVSFPTALRTPAAFSSLRTSQQLGQRDVALEQVRALRQSLPRLMQSDRLQRRGLPPGVAPLSTSTRRRDQNRLRAFLQGSQ